VDAAELGALLRAHPFLRVERPPELWGLHAELEPLVGMLGELFAAALARNGGALGDVTLGVATVVVEPDAAGFVPAGEYVALTVGGAGDWRPETRWPALVNDAAAAKAAAAGAVGSYTRDLGGSGSATVFFARAADGG
jgi:hypothetical protein